jgi:hypothetical protein
MAATRKRRAKPSAVRLTPGLARLAELGFLVGQLTALLEEAVATAAAGTVPDPGWQRAAQEACRRERNWFRRLKAGQ